jgi:hypothetical protein
LGRSGEELAIAPAGELKGFSRKSGCASVHWPGRYGLPAPPEEPAPGSDELFHNQLGNAIDLKH